MVLKRVVSNPDLTLVGHNIKYDMGWLSVKYPKLKLRAKVFDTMLAAYFLDENNGLSLEDTMSNYLNIPASHKGMVNTHNLESEHLDDVLLYNAKDAEVEQQLLPVLCQALRKEKVLRLATVGMKILPILNRMEVKGVRIDVPKAQAIRKKLLEDCVTMRLELREMHGAFDPDSSTDLIRILYGTMRFRPEKLTKTGAPSTDYEALKLLDDQVTTEEQATFLALLIKYKKSMKLLSSVYQKIEVQTKYDGRRHPKYNLGKQYGESEGGTVTGRLSGDMQQIPRGKEHKGIFIPGDGYVFIDGDFGQLELRVVAFLAREPVMMAAFESGQDIHTAVMADLLGYDYDWLCNIIGDDNRGIKPDSNNLKYAELKELRVAIKRINFGIVYGVAGDRLRRLLKVEMGLDKTKEWCDDLIKQWLTKYSRIAQYLKATRDAACMYQVVKTVLGQRRRLPDATPTPYGTADHIRIASSRAQRQAQNFVVQSLASWICLIGMYLLQCYLDAHTELDGHIVLQVHDSVTCEIKKGSNNLKVRDDIRNIMEVKTLDFLRDFFGVDFNVPLKFETNLLEKWG